MPLMLKQKIDWGRGSFCSFQLTRLNSEHEDSFYQESCYYLDNLCADFRYQRRGIGSLLLDWGLKVADEMKLSVATEAGPKGHGLYLKHGFKQTGWFTVAADGEEFRMPVLKLDYLPK
jgi:GNAT superfamily N-acetyltransferase